jgi:threonine dehydrogenase-like Zn-dependent dehydrogenase
MASLIEHKVLRDGARIAMLGGRERLDYPFNRAQETELEFVHSMHHSNDEVEQVLRFRREGRFGIGPLITHRLAPSEVPGFWRSVLAGSRDHIGVVIDWSRT